jgi:sulfatase modifying factor 1
MAVENMQFVRGGAFEMGSEDFYPEEAPCRNVRVDDFWIDETPVTNREFRRLARIVSRQRSIIYQSGSKLWFD